MARNASDSCAMPLTRHTHSVMLNLPLGSFFGLIERLTV
jgi:hypothetical protein